MTSARYSVDDLRTFATTLFERAGLAAHMARDVADILLEGDLLGHTTHGLALAAPYLREIENHAMAREGDPQVVAARGAVQIWDGTSLHHQKRHSCCSFAAVLSLGARAVPRWSASFTITTCARRP